MWVIKIKKYTVTGTTVERSKRPSNLAPEIAHALLGRAVTWLYVAPVIADLILSSRLLQLI